jgi:hypothetical protein
MKYAISIEQPGSNLVRRVKLQYISLAAGLALAATAAVGLGGRTSAVPAAPRAVTSASQTILQQERPTVVFYLASSPEAAALANSYEEIGQWIRVENRSAEPLRSVQILDVSTPAGATHAKAIMDDAMAAANFISAEAPRFVIVEMP